MGKIGKGTKCSVNLCNETAVRSISINKVRVAGIEVEGKRAYLCKEHYKKFKKGYKKEKQIEKWRFGVS
jgi:hypothetical protein